MTNTLPTAAYDNKIYAKFSKKTIDKKKVNKEEFQKEFNLNTNPKKMLLGITVELSGKNGCDLLKEMLDGLEAIDIQVAIRGVGTEQFQKLLIDFAEKNPKRITILEDSEENIRKIYAASDVCIFFSNNLENKNEIKNALSYASLPIVPISLKGLIEDYNPNLESGNGFLFMDNNVWSAFAALVRASEHYRFPYDWKVICQNALEE